MCRHLSAVAEDCELEDKGSMSMKKNPLRDLIQAVESHRNSEIEPIVEDKYETSPYIEVPSPETNQDNDQEKLFCDDKNTPFSANDKDDVTMPAVQLKPVLQPIMPVKKLLANSLAPKPTASFSTEKSSGPNRS